MDNRGHCPACECDHAVSTRYGGKLAGASIGAAVAKLLSRRPWAPLVGLVLGALAGEIADRTILPRCPTCGAVLELIGAAVREPARLLPPCRARGAAFPA
jgi:hypothetical protein